MKRLAYLFVVVFVPAAILAQAPPPADRSARFDVASVKPNTGNDLSIHYAEQPADGYRQDNLPLASYITYAFDIRQNWRVAGLPGWTRAERFDITGKAGRPVTEDDRRAMLRELLASRFGLTTHSELREQQMYALTAPAPPRPLGPGLRLRPDCAAAKCDSGGTGWADGLQIRGVTLAQFAAGMLSNLLGQMVRDETAIEGVFDVTMSWRPESAANDSSDTRPSMFTAVEEQLGLRLEPRRGQADVLVIDRVERPAAN